MRNAFAQQITALAQQDPRVVVLSGDIGNRLFDDLKAKCPDRFFNCGVAEANMIGMAAGLALAGLRPFCYTITPFLTYRCLEQIRVDLCYHHLPVVLVGTGSGLSYASLGATHHSCEEMGMLRLLPNLTVAAPADRWEVRAALRASLLSNNPVYLRIGKKGEPDIHTAEPDFQFGRAIPLRSGQDVALLATGTVLPVALAAADLLAAQGFSTSVLSFHTLKPLDTTTLADTFSRHRVVVTIEEHSILGGLGGAVAEWRADQPDPHARLLRFGTRDEFLHLTCDQHEAREHFGLTPQAISSAISNALRNP